MFLAYTECENEKRSKVHGHRRYPVLSCTNALSITKTFACVYIFVLVSGRLARVGFWEADPNGRIPLLVPHIGPTRQTRNLLHLYAAQSLWGSVPPHPTRDPRKLQARSAGRSRRDLHHMQNYYFFIPFTRKGMVCHISLPRAENLFPTLRDRKWNLFDETRVSYGPPPAPECMEVFLASVRTGDQAWSPLSSVSRIACKSQSSKIFPPNVSSEIISWRLEKGLAEDRGSGKVLISLSF